MFSNRRKYAVCLTALALALMCLAVLIWPDAPLIGGTVSAQTTPTPGSWTPCAVENATCTFSGTKRVRYGANGTYTYGNFTDGVQCSVDVFGDPLYGTAKTCDIETPPTPGSWTRCADEGGFCGFDGTKQVRYGAGGTYNYATFIGGVNCSNAVFGDPLYGTGKSCDYQTPLTPSPSATPWQTDPMGSPGNYTLFRDDNLFIAGEVAYPQGTYPGNDSCDNNATLGYNNRSFNAKPGSSLTGFDDAANVPQQATGHLSNLRIVGGAGRILKPDTEQGIIYKLSNFQGSNIGQATYSVELFDKTGSLYQHSFAPVSATQYSHLDVAAGDLDRLRNANGEYQDEVVLVSESGNKTMQLTVISFLNGAANPLITTLDTKIPVAYFIDPVDGNTNFNKGGQVSVAVGDFNADGKMEIAATSMYYPSLNLSLYRYTNDGQDNAQILLNDQQNITNAYLYADVAAGDFTGAGHDQVMVGWVGPDGPEHNVSIAAYDITTDPFSGNLQFGRISGPNTLGSSRNGISSQCGRSTYNCNDSITQPGWVQLKAGLFKYDPFNGYGVRRRQLGVVWGNSRPAFGLAEIPPGSKTIGWLPGTGGTLVDATAGPGYCVGCRPEESLNVAAEVPDTREAYTIMAGNFGGFNPQNPAWQLGIVSPYRTTTTPSYTFCTGFEYYFHYVDVRIAAYQYTQGNDAGVPYTFSLQNLPVPASAGDWTWTKRTLGSRGVAAVALDLDGNSMHLGAPVRIVVDNLFTTDAVLQEPPKHLDWVCSNFDQPGAKCDFVNASRYKEFNLTYTYESSTETSNEVTSTADTSTGQSSVKTAEETFSAGVPDIASVDLDAEQKFESESDFKTSQENYNKSSTKRSFTYEFSTDQADQISAHTRTLVVYRYPLYGPPDPANPGQQKFYDLTLPVDTAIVPSPGDTSEWYQPIHENGNLLTYPFTPNFDPKSDYGFYAVAGQGGKCSVTTSLPCQLNSDCPGNETCSGALPGLLGPAAVNTWGSNATTNGITYDQAGTTGAKLLTSQTLKSSEEFKFGFKANWKLPIEVVDVGGSVGGSLQYNTNDESSWSNSSVSESTTSSSKGIEFNLPSIPTSFNYQYKTWAYITEGGFLKVAHSADVTSANNAASSWYAQTYGQTYDLALNLPRKFLPDVDSSEEGKFTLNTDISRKETKSISISDPDLKTMDGSPAYISGGIDSNPNTPQGKKLQLNARVYNLSTAKAIAGTDANLVARFELVPYNPSNASEGARQTIATAQIPAIDYYASPSSATDCTGLRNAKNPNYPVCNSTVVSADWDTTGLQPGQYRLYVVLDPNNALPDEYHEWQDRRTDPLLQVAGDPDPDAPVDDNRTDSNGRPFHLEKGQNNEGWTYINIVAPSADTLSNRTPELSMSKASLAADDFGPRLSTNRARANIHTPVRIRAQINSDGDNLGNQHVLFFDHDPDQGGKPFAARLLRGVTKGANHLWVTYTPRKLGEQHIWARVVEHAADTKPGNHTDTLVLNVRPADKRPPRLFVTMTPKVLSPPDDRMVEVAATILAEDNQDRAPRIRLEAITHNDGNDASADISGAVFGTDDRQFALRAKRATRGEEPLVYEVVYSATDRSGNKTYAKAYVTVPRRR